MESLNSGVVDFAAMADNQHKDDDFSVIDTWSMIR